MAEANGLVLYDCIFEGIRVVRVFPRVMDALRRSALQTAAVIECIDYCADDERSARRKRHIPLKDRPTALSLEERQCSDAGRVQGKD